MKEQVTAEWQNRPLADYSCLEAHNLSADRLASDGVSPNDPRIQRIFEKCADETAKAIALPVAASHSHNFAVDGLAVGGAVFPDSPAYKAYKCKTSDEFAGFTWCANKRPMVGKFGAFDSWTTILHSNTNIAAFILQDVMPAYFPPGNVERKFDRLSQYFGQRARVITGEPRSDAPHSIIATWGDVTLTPLDESTMEALRRGENVTVGLVIDFLANSRKSAREGLPVFRIGGEAGYIWAAEFDDSGKGRLRITAVNSSLLPTSNSESSPPVAYAPNPSPAVGPTQATPDPAQIEKERAARLERALAAAKQQLDDAAVFIKEHGNSPNLFEYVDRINVLKAAVKTAEPDDIEHRSTELTNVISHDRDYQQYLIQLAEAKKKLDAQYLLDAIHRGQKERDFIHDYIAEKPLADATTTLAPLVKQLYPALQRADFDQLQPLVGKIDTAIREANLESAFIASQTEKKADATRGTSVSSTDKLPTTEKNRFLVEGDLDDLELLYNSSPTAPNVAQNLRGDFVFAQAQARVCLFGENPDGLALIAKQAIVEKASPKAITVTFYLCDPEKLLSYDILAMQRNAFLRSRRDDALAVLKSVESDNYRKFAEVTAIDLGKAADVERTTIEKIKANIADGAPDGFGLILLKTDSSNLCLAVGQKIPAHRQLLLLAEDKLNLETQRAVVIKDTNADEAFIDIQRHQCGAVCASPIDLKAITDALARGSIPYALSSLWFLPADVERADAALAEKIRAAAQEETARMQRNADQSRLAYQRAEDLSATQTARQATLRQDFGKRAKGAADALGSEISAWTKEQTGQIGLSTRCMLRG